MKKVGSLLLTVLFALAALIWVVRVVVDVIYGVPDLSMAVFLLDIVCALVWVIAFLVQLFRHRARKKEN